MKYSVVIAEDNRREIKNIKYLVDQTENLEVAAVFQNGEDAAEYLKNNACDILITDIQMPRMTGIDLVRYIRENNIDVRILLVSNYAYFEYAKTALELGVESYVLKPFVDTEFQNALEKAVKETESSREAELDIKRMHEYIDKSLPVLKKNFIMDIMTNRNADYKYLCENEEMFQVALKDKDVAVAHCFVDNAENAGSDICEEIQAYIDETGMKNFEVYSANISKGEFAIIIAGGAEQDITDVLREILIIMNYVENCFKTDIYIGLSKYDYITEIKLLYEESKHFLNSAINKGMIFAINLDRKNLKKSTTGKMILKALEYLEDVLKGGESEKLNSFLKDYIGICSEDDIERFAFGYINMLEIIMNGYSTSLGSIADIKMIWNKLCEFNKIINVSVWLTNITDVAIYYIRSSKAESARLVGKIKDIIESRFSENISLRTIANEVNFSTRHIHRIFVKATGKSVHKYLTDYRIEKAKFLLKEKTINEVCVIVGYNDPKYFSKIFKDNTGKSPNEYLKELKNTNE